MSQDTMTVKELAEVAGVSADTIRRAAKHHGINAENGRTLRFDAAQAINIIGAIRYRGDRRVEPSQNAKLPSQSAKVDWTIVHSLAEQNAVLSRHLSEVVPAMMKMADACMTMARGMTSQPALSAPDYMTVSGFCHEKRIVCDGESAKRWGRMARELSDVRGHEVRTVPDQRWGKVNAYRTSVLAEVVGQ